MNLHDLYIKYVWNEHNGHIDDEAAFTAEVKEFMLGLIGEDEDNYSELPPDSMAYKELRRVAEIANSLRAELRSKVIALCATTMQKKSLR